MELLTLLDAARISPDIVEAIGECSLGEGLDLLVAFLPDHSVRMLLHLFVCDLVFSPYVRKDRISRYRLEFLE